MSPTRILCAWANASGFGINAPAASRPAEVKNFLRFISWSSFIFASMSLTRRNDGVLEYWSGGNPETQYSNTPSLQYSASSFYLARSLKRWILPVAVFGNSATNSIQRGYL